MKFQGNNSIQVVANDEILSKEVRIVGDNADGGVYKIDAALRLAKSLDLDLILISNNSNPPVCKILDLKKYIYEQKKKKKEIAQKSHKMVIKEIRFGPNTDDHDFNFKVKNARKFLVDGAKVRAFVFFKGRTIMYKDKGSEVLHKLKDELKDISRVENEISLEGKRMFITLAPIKIN